ncbi:thioredoxin family protein [bacterium]|nr:thioredoxin family protein [candidate division CSSED10-310 bacterium]
MKHLILFLIISTLVPATIIQAVEVDSWEHAMRTAADREVPILLTIGISWSPQSQKFEQALQEDPALKKFIDEQLVHFKVVAEHEPGAALARKFGVENYPYFILLNSAGELMDRWYGYGECTIGRLQTICDDPVTLNQRLARFRMHPTEEDARRLGELRHAEGLFAEAAAFYQRASELNPDSEVEYDMLILTAMAYGNYYKLFSAGQLKAQADAILNGPRRTPEKLVKIAFAMGKLANREKDLSYFLPYLKTAVAETADIDDPELQKLRRVLLPEYELYITKNLDKALEYQKQAQPEDWLENAALMNNFAWWCFENKINLDEAEELARKALKLAVPGRETANISDTLAEILALKGDLKSAVKFSRKAVEADPEYDYFQKQQQKFESMLAKGKH